MPAEMLRIVRQISNQPSLPPPTEFGAADADENPVLNNLMTYDTELIAIEEEVTASTTPPSFARVSIKGKFFFEGEKKFYIKGVSYGAFEPNESKQEYFDKERIRRDFAQMVANGINTVRIPHTTPPVHLLDIAHEFGLRVMVGLSAEQYVGYLIDREKMPDMKRIMQEKVRRVAGHPALLAVALGNEITASMARWIGREQIEPYLERIYRWVKEVDPSLLVTYVNYPTTEYIQLPFLDFLCFNVYLENKNAFEAYLGRLQNMAGDRPLMLGEIGLDSLRNGEEKQAEFLEWQIQSTFDMGCSGLVIFSWTDEWFRGGEEVYDWAFGITTKNRTPKPALAAMKKAFSRVPFCADASELPKISVVVCTYNGSATIKQCLEGLSRLNYPNYEVLVINDGSTDRTEEIVSQFDVRLITTENKGLSSARNLGMNMAEGEIVAYIDDDAFPDPDWLYYLGRMFATTDFAAIGGPNISPPSPGFIADCVDHTPGAPTHILFSDTDAEHIPGCNMAFRKNCLAAVGGFDVQFRTAGDDVDVCWKIQESGWRIGYCAAALVWHHRRGTVKGFWRQQKGYGKAEALLERKWPEKYNSYGHRTWGGRIYGNGHSDATLFGHWRVYHGMWGMAPFQSLYGPPSENMLSAVLMPEWYLISGTLIVSAAMGYFWSPLSFLAPLAIVVASLPLMMILKKVSKAKPVNEAFQNGLAKTKFQAVTACLNMLQPMARLWGRLAFSLTPWRKFGAPSIYMPVRRVISVWCEDWIAPETRLTQLMADLRKQDPPVIWGNDYGRWDLGIRGGVFGLVRVIMAAEDHAGGKQYLRFRLEPRLTLRSKYLLFFLLILMAIAFVDKAVVPLAIVGFLSLVLLARGVIDCSIATAICTETIEKQGKIIE